MLDKYKVIDNIEKTINHIHNLSKNASMALKAFLDIVESGEFDISSISKYSKDSKYDN